MDAEKWEELSRDLDYNEKPKEDRPVQENEVVFEDYEAPDLSPKFDMSIIRVVSLIFVIALLIALLIYLFDKDFFARVNTRKNLVINIEDPDYLDLSDLERALIHSIDNQDFKSAIRVYYLILLERLDSLKLIKWRKAKTNRQYIIEMRNSDVEQDLRNLTRVYEDVWFGDLELNSHNFKVWEQRFKIIISSAK